jgi:hypothetical protein
MMTMMTDREVGELWRDLNRPIDHECSLARHGRALIRKLVEERTRLYEKDKISHAHIVALRDFGIDPKEWK